MRNIKGSSPRWTEDGAMDYINARELIFKNDKLTVVPVLALRPKDPPPGALVELDFLPRRRLGAHVHPARP